MLTLINNNSRDKVMSFLSTFINKLKHIIFGHSCALLQCEAVTVIIFIYMCVCVCVYQRCKVLQFCHTVSDCKYIVTLKYVLYVILHCAPLSFNLN